MMIADDAMYKSGVILRRTREIIVASRSERSEIHEIVKITIERIHQTQDIIARTDETLRGYRTLCGNSFSDV